MESIQFPIETLKCILIGNSGVGKSSLVCHFTENKFTDQDTTIGVEFGSREVKVDNQTYKLQVWDTAGQETFRAITKSYYRMAMGVLLVYDVTNRISFQDIPGWYRSITENCRQSIPIILVGNKSDQPDAKRLVSFNEGQALANQYQIAFCEATATNFDSTKKVFQRIADKMVQDRIPDRTNQDHQIVEESLVKLQGLVDLKTKRVRKFGGCC